MKLKNYLLLCFLLFLLVGCIEPDVPDETPPEAAPEEPPPTAPPEVPEQPPRVEPDELDEPLEEFIVPPLKERIPISPPEGELKSITLGDIEISHFTTAIMRGHFETSTDILFYVKNRGDTTKTVKVTALDQLTEQIPENVYHFFSFQEDIISIGPGEEKNFWYFISNEGDMDFELNVEFQVGSSKRTAKINIKSEKLRPECGVYIYGKVKDKNTGNPIKDAEVRVNWFNGRDKHAEKTDGFGRYVVCVLAKEDIQNVFGNRTVLYDSFDYFVTVDEPGYKYFYKGTISPPKREESLRLDIELENASELNFNLLWEKQVNDNYGFFWVMPADNFSVIAAAQAKHPPMLDKPTNFYLFSDKGEILWKQRTENECWGFDITDDGEKIAAGCHDGYTYVVKKDGTLLWKDKASNMNREVEFSTDETKLITGPYEGYSIALVDSSDGEVITSYETDEWLRNSKFYHDGSGYVTGHGEGSVISFDMDGKKQWERKIGEFPLFMEIDNNGNVYLAGKSRTLFSYDKNGILRWSYRIPDHVVTVGDISENNKIAIGTVGGWVYLFDSDGTLLWRRSTMQEGGQWGGSIGHNAVAISDDGEYIVYGTAPENELLVLDANGTMVWSYKTQTRENSEDLLAGVMSVDISSDNSKIVAGYGDNYIRMFELENN